MSRSARRPPLTPLQGDVGVTCFLQGKLVKLLGARVHRHRDIAVKLPSVDIVRAKPMVGNGQRSAVESEQQASAVLFEETAALRWLPPCFP